MRSLKLKLAKLIAVALIGFMPVTPAMAEVTELNMLGEEYEFPRVSRAFTQMDAVFEREALERTVAQVLRVDIGDTKQQLVGSVGQPVSAYADGSWNFDLSFRLPQGNRLICQYRVFFDEDDQVAGTIWRRPQCVDIMNGKGS